MKTVRNLVFLVLLGAFVIFLNSPGQAVVGCGGGSCGPSGWLPYHCFWNGAPPANCSGFLADCDGFCANKGGQNFYVGTCNNSTLTGYCECNAVGSCPCPENCTEPDPCEDNWEACTNEGPVDMCSWEGGCAPGETPVGCWCTSNPSPILLDVANDGFILTDTTGGVTFAIGPSDLSYRVAWTVRNSDDAWLTLDRNGNGIIDNGQELFGNFTPQDEPPPGETKNGFLALAELDRASQGGNSDGRVDVRDSGYSALRLWQDSNHNGISENVELYTLQSLRIEAIELAYKESRRRDRFGNVFKLRGKVYDAFPGNSGRWAYDVFLKASRAE